MAAKKGTKLIHTKLRSVPYDMMRYDRCCLFTEEDSGKLERLAHAYPKDGDHYVTFISYSEHAPTVARWRSFGAVVETWEYYPYA